jgi:hypothetical protein
MKTSIKLSTYEINNNRTRVQHAENIIRRLPVDHDGRNGWLLNYGVSQEAAEIRSRHCHGPVKWDPATDSAETRGTPIERANHIPPAPIPRPARKFDPMDELVNRFPNQPEFQTPEQDAHAFKIVLFKMFLGLGAAVSFAIWAWVWSH